MIKSWWKLIKDAIPAAYMENERLDWELEEAISLLREKMSSYGSHSAENIAWKAMKIAGLREYMEKQRIGRRPIKIWENVTKLYLRVVKQEERFGTPPDNAIYYNSKRHASMSARLSGHYWVAACLCEENEHWEMAGSDYQWAANVELEDPEAKIEALNKSAECYQKYLDVFDLKGESRDEILLKIHYNSLAALKIKKRLINGESEEECE